MHDSKGREIHEGDIVAGKDWMKGNRLSAFKVIGCCEGSESCNLNTVGFERIVVTTLSANETELILMADGTLPPAATEASK